jgi:hypothetical protein
MTEHLLISPIDIEIVTYGQLPADIVGYAREKMIGVAWHSVEPVRHARVKVSGFGQPYQAKASLDIGGSPLRAHVAGASARDAVDLLADRLEYRVAKPVDDWAPEPGGRPAYLARPSGQREIVRHKAYELIPQSPGQARYEMERLDYDFHLFVDAQTGREAVVHRAGPSGYGLAEPVGVLTSRAAVERLDESGQPFLFFVDPVTGRGRVLYRRYDGHYGLVRPA